jgi:hypothetical protein
MALALHSYTIMVSARSSIVVLVVSAAIGVIAAAGVSLPSAVAGGIVAGLFAALATRSFMERVAG